MNPTSDEYDWGNARINPFEPMTHQDACRTVDFMSDSEIHKIGYRDETELLDYIDRHYMLYETGT
jgi:hypothetical protein